MLDERMQFPFDRVRSKKHTGEVKVAIGTECISPSCSIEVGCMSCIEILRWTLRSMVKCSKVVLENQRQQLCLEFRCI